MSLQAAQAQGHTAAPSPKRDRAHCLGDGRSVTSLHLWEEAWSQAPCSTGGLWGPLCLG